ncbi:hypothetical protein B9Z55_017399 [Caenorhabditis nigoni]|uniref:G-protein coupled receptors family 1 profile domain-containing protein n=3 Tax=Caenorhabditis nigoni TaxID=1611254 RepID=A0A2G5T9V9_9PELO|nr:hypothetical protein B9Z55_017399 [Caenorhabditis nigoni]
MNMYQGLRTIRRTVQEVWVYISVGLMPLTMIPFIYALTPNQEKAKRAMIHDYKVYPDCVYDVNSVIVCNPLNNCAIIFAIINLANVVGSTFIIFYATHKAYILLSKRMMTKSNKTKRMHQKFNKRTRLQAFVIFTFANFPILMANLILLIDIETAWPSYIIDILRENQPNASLLTLFLFYDPYQLYLTTIWRKYRKHFSKRIVRVKSVHYSENNQRF